MGLNFMKISQIKLSTILIPIGAFGGLLLLAMVFIPGWKLDFLAYPTFVAFTFFPLGLLVWFYESSQKSFVEPQPVANKIRWIGVIVGITCLIIFVRALYLFAHAWD